MTPLRTILALLLLLVLAVPAGAQTDEPVGEAEPALHEPCTDTGDATVITPEEGFTGTVETPIGVAGSTRAPAGTYVVDLAGLPEGTRRSVTFVLSMPDPSDYDLVVNGDNLLATDNPEYYTLRNSAHCRTITVETEVFLGLPTDTLELGAKVASK